MSFVLVSQNHLTCNSLDVLDIVTQQRGLLLKLVARDCASFGLELRRGMTECRVLPGKSLLSSNRQQLFS